MLKLHHKLKNSDNLRQDRGAKYCSFESFPPQVFTCSEFLCVFFSLERPFEMFLQYSRNGIVIGSIDDVMSGFHSLIGSINQNELPTPPSTGE